MDGTRTRERPQPGHGGGRASGRDTPLAAAICALCGLCSLFVLEALQLSYCGAAGLK